MADDRDGFEDLFEDLDKFFAPDPDEPAQRSTPAEATPSRPPVPTEPTPPAIDAAPPPAPPAVDATAEMPAARDWGRLGDVLGDEDDGGEVEFTSGVPEVGDYPDDLGYGMGLPAPGRAASRDPDRRPLLGGRLRDPDERPPTPAGSSDAPDPPGAAEDASTVPASTPPLVPSTPPRAPRSGFGQDMDEPFVAEALWHDRTLADVGSAADELQREFASSTPADDDLLGEFMEPVATAAVEPGPAPGAEERPVGAGGVTSESAAGATPGGPAGVSAPQVAAPRTPRTVRVTEPEALTEPPAGAPSPVPPRRGFLAPREDGSRNLPAAVFSGVVLAVLGLLFLAFSRPLFALLAGAIVLYAQAELYATIQRRGHQPATLLGLVMGGLLIAAAYWKGEGGMLLVVGLTLLATLLWFMFSPSRARESTAVNAGLTLLGFLYVPFLAGYVFVILSQANQGRALTLAVLGLTFLYDVAAFAVGSGWGSTPLAPAISPKKTWQGLWGATLITLIVALVVLPWAVGAITVARALGMFVVVAVFAPLGDLAESALKRDLGVKDMGSLLPGHGGALDRIDSVLFVAPAMFYLMRAFF